MNVLEVNNITKTFGNTKAVDKVSFSIGESVIFGLIGPNGAGKTTIIRMVMNIIIPDSGRVVVLANANLQTANDSIGYLPEARGLHHTSHHIQRGQRSRDGQGLLDLLLDSIFHAQCDVCPYRR